MALAFGGKVDRFEQTLASGLQTAQHGVHGLGQAFVKNNVPDLHLVLL